MEKLKIAMLTTWNTVCGIAQNTKFLIDALQGLGHEVQIVCQKPFGQEVDFGKGYNVTRGWEWYGRTNKVEVTEEAKAVVKGCDVVHVQYESFLWHESYLNGLVPNDAPLVITHHSSCTGPGCPVNRASANLVHDPEFPNLPNRRVIPMGIPDTFGFASFDETLPIVGSFGLHRNDDEFCLEATRLASEKLLTPIAYRTHYGDKEWQPTDELVKQLKECRLLVLMYPPVDAVVSSSAACFALGTGVPVVTSDTRWFKHLSKYIYFVESHSELAEIIKSFMTSKEYWELSQSNSMRAVEDRGWAKTAQKHIDVYKEIVG